MSETTKKRISNSAKKAIETSKKVSLKNHSLDKKLSKASSLNANFQEVKNDTQINSKAIARTTQLTRKYTKNLSIGRATSDKSIKVVFLLENR